MLVAANEDRVKKLDKLIKKEAFYEELAIQKAWYEKAHDKEKEQRIELEKLVEAYKKDLEEQLRLKEEARMKENETIAVTELTSNYDDVSDKLSVVRESLANLEKENNMMQIGMIEHMESFNESNPAFGGVSPRFDVNRQNNDEFFEVVSVSDSVNFDRMSNVFIKNNNSIS